MADKLNVRKKSLKGFSLVELLIAIGIFAIVVSANFALAMNAYRGRANDRVRLEAGLVIKDTVNGIYTYKTTNWSGLIAAMQEDGSKQLNLDEVTSQFQLNNGSWTSGNITFEIFIDKASREDGEINPENSGSDPDTVKLTVVASWRDFFGIDQSISENYFLSNWSSERWSETTHAEFTDGLAATPVFNKTIITNDNGDGSVVLGDEIVYANNDWCTINVKNMDTGSNTALDLLASKSSQTNLGYEIYEPTVADFNSIVAPPLPLSPSQNTLTLNNVTQVCDSLSGDLRLDCETLAKFYKFLDGENWTNKTGWESIDLGGTSQYCNWYGIDCIDGRVTEIDLDNNNLSGSIPREIGNLSELKELSLTNNANLNGSLPPEIGLLQDLEILRITNADVDGRIPETIGNLAQLETLVIEDTEITGNIPASIGLLTNLQVLTLKDSKLTCHIPPEITLLTNLSGANRADLSGNHLLQTRYEEIGDLVDLDAQSSPLDLDEEALVDCARNPAESDIVVSKSSLSERSLLNITLANEDFPMSDFTEEIAGLDRSEWTSGGLAFVDDVVKVSYDNVYNRMSDGYGFTISLWVNPTTSNGTNYNRIIDFSDGSSGWFLSYGAGGDQNKAYFYHYGANSVALTSTSNLSVDQWTHIAVVFDGGDEESTARMYINGTQVSTDSYEELTPFSDVDGNLNFGNNEVGNLGPNIKMDEVRMYNRALPQTEINLTKDFEVGRDDPGLVGYWRMNHEVNFLFTTVYDYSYKNNHGTTNDTSLTTGRVEYRINSIYHYKEKIFFGTTHPTDNILIYDSLSGLWNGVNFGLSNTNYDTQAILVNGEKGLVLHDSYLLEFNPDAETITFSPTQINQGGNGIKSPISMGVSGSRIFITGLDPMRNLQFIDIKTNGDLELQPARNILLDTYL